VVRQSDRNANPYQKVDTEIDRINKKYLQAIPIAVTRVSGSLYVRGTFPPKLGEVEPKQHRLPLGLKAHADNLYDARIRAHEIGTQLLLGKWEWPEAKDKFIPHAVADFAAMHRSKYLEKNGDTIDKRKYWDKDFGYAFKKLIANRPPSLDACLTIAKSYKANSRSRKRYVKAFAQLLKIAGFTEPELAPLTALSGSYQAEAVDPRNIPDISTIIEWYDRVPDSWKFFYFLLACFGLRGTEAHCDNCRLDDLPKGELQAYGDKGKKWRFVPTCSQKMLKQMARPAEWHRLDRSPGQLSDDFGKMLASLGCPFVAYDLRHHYAYYTLLQRWDVVNTARYMGHSVTVHCNIYLLCIDMVRERAILEMEREEREKW
jgi:hypothetical protein